MYFKYLQHLHTYPKHVLCNLILLLVPMHFVNEEQEAPSKQK